MYVFLAAVMVKRRRYSVNKKDDEFLGRGKKKPDGNKATEKLQQDCEGSKAEENLCSCFKSTVEKIGKKFLQPPN